MLTLARLRLKDISANANAMQVFSRTNTFTDFGGWQFAYQPVFRVPYMLLKLIQTREVIVVNFQCSKTLGYSDLFGASSHHN